jgi:hypothetical protein
MAIIVLCVSTIFAVSHGRDDTSRVKHGGIVKDGRCTPQGGEKTYRGIPLCRYQKGAHISI